MSGAGNAERKSILFASTLFPPLVVGGAELSTQALAKGFQRAGHKVSVFTLKEDGLPSRSIEDGIEIFRVPARLPYWPFDGKHHGKIAKLGYHVWDNYNLPAVRQFETVLRETKPDIVSTQAITGFSAGVWRSAAKAGARVVHSVRDYIALCPRSTMYRSGVTCERPCGDCAVLTLGRKMLSRHVDAVVTNSDYVRRKHLEAGYFSKASWSVIPPTVDTEAFQDHRPDPDGIIRFGFAGRISPEKGPDQLVDALAIAGIENWRCIIAGRGDAAYVDDLKKRADPRISFPGWMKPADFYASVDVVVAPSLWPEPAGRTIIEAYAHGLPVIASTQGGMSESVVEGLTGWIVDPRSLKALAFALQRSADPADRSRLDPAKMMNILADRTITNAIKHYSKAFDCVEAVDG